MTAKEQQRVAILEQVAQGQLSGVEAAALLGVTPRQLRRLRAAYQARGRRAWSMATGDGRRATRSPRRSASRSSPRPKARTGAATTSS